jgi:hypothetical protein
MIQAKIIADSKNQYGNRLTTMVITFPRFILAEFNTHRMLSKNSASSRAIPFKKMVKMVEENPFIPIAWQKDHKGMQGTEYFDEIGAETCKIDWLTARNYAVQQAKILNESGGVTKQLCNRLLEPFMWHTVIISATEWENFFALRCPIYTWEYEEGIIVERSKEDFIRSFIKKYPTNAKSELYDMGLVDEHLNPNNSLNWYNINKGQSEIHMMALAEVMWDAMNESTPKELKAGEWHIPFGDTLENGLVIEDLSYIICDKNGNYTDEQILEAKLKIATARCARISYTVIGKESKEADYTKDIKLHDILVKSSHWSPFEHSAKAMSDEEYNTYLKGVIELIDIDEPEYNGGIYELKYSEKGWCNNFKGFIQYRKIVENETMH